MVYIDEHFHITYPSTMQNYVLTSVTLAKQKRQLYCKIFNTSAPELARLKVIFFTTRQSFVNYIKKIADGHEPPPWAKGCFYHNEIQILLDLKDERQLLKRKTALSHELLHLFFKQYIYQKYDYPRVRWLDESFACALEKEEFSYALYDFPQIARQLTKMKNFDLNQLDDITKINPPDGSYQGYMLFNLVGEYIKRNNLYQELLQKIVKDYSSIRALGTTILSDSVNYFMQAREH